MELSDFESKIPEEHYSEFLIKKDAFVKMVNLGIFSIPVNVISITFHLYHLAKDNFLFNSTLFALISTVYFFVSDKGIKKRYKLRDELNTMKVSKNTFCRRSLDNFEICKASSREKSYIIEFMRLHWNMTIMEIKYFVLSENFRLATRSILLLLKMFFILVKTNNPLFDLASVFIRIRDLDVRILGLRNNFYFFLEYWNELKMIEKCSIVNSEKVFPLKVLSSVVSGFQNDSIITDSAIASSTITDSTISDSTISDSTIASSTITDSAISDSIITDSAMASSTITDSIILASKICENDLLIYRNSSSNTVKLSTDIENPSKEVKIFKRKKTLIVGSQGSGKTTFLNELVGMKAQFWRFSECFVPGKTISFCSQKQLIFNNSVLFNLKYGSSLDDNSVIAKLKSMNVLSFFEDFENGLYTSVGSKSCGLSGGQRQIICLMRCLLKEADVYIFDQPTLFLDKENIKLLFNLIENLKNKTVLVTMVTDEMQRYFDKVIYFRSKLTSIN